MVVSRLMVGGGERRSVGGSTGGLLEITVLGRIIRNHRFREIWARSVRLALLPARKNRPGDFSQNTNKFVSNHKFGRLN
jgi:hypothetical protein